MKCKVCNMYRRALKKYPSIAGQLRQDWAYHIANTCTATNKKVKKGKEE